MIDQLFDETRNYGEPNRRKYALDQLESAYLRQCNAELKDVFVEGFCAAMELVWETIDRLTHGGT